MTPCPPPGGDPTVRRLEERVAAPLQGAGSLRTQWDHGNQLLWGSWVPPVEVLLEEESHIIQWEEGAPAVLWGLQLRPIPGSTDVRPGHGGPSLRGDGFSARTSVLS